MSVLACNRKGCDNIMCDRLSLKHGYICNECFDELVALGVGTDIDGFMRSNKQIDNSDADYVYFDTIFKVANND